MSNPVFYAEPAELASLAPGDSLSVGGAEGRHAVTVKRLAAGEPVDVCDGGGLRLVCTVTDASAGTLTARVERVVHEAAGPGELVLIQALAKGDRDELAVETATELGVDAVVPWQAERSIVRWKAEKAARGVAKWRNVVAAAAKQARRSRIPRVGEPAVGTAAVCALIRSAGLALILHEDAVDTLADVVRGWRSGRPVGGEDTVLMIVGPEGGISPVEVAAFTEAGARMAVLGRHVLRSSTAGPAAVVLLNQELGRW